MLAIAFGEGMQNVHKDEITVALYNEIAKHAGLDAVFQELYREWLISGGVTTVTPFTREPIQFFPEGADRQRTRDVAVPLIGVLHAEQIRVLGNDMFGTGTLAYRPAVGKQEQWLREFFDRGTTPARKAEMRREDPLLTTMLVEQLSIRDEEPSMIDQGVDPAIGDELYRLNPRMVKRSTMPKGSWKYPRPPLTANFALLEAKRLLNLMDYALLQGGSNFLVVAKKGSDQRPAQSPRRSPTCARSSSARRAPAWSSATTASRSRSSPRTSRSCCRRASAGCWAASSSTLCFESRSTTRTPPATARRRASR